MRIIWAAAAVVILAGCGSEPAFDRDAVTANPATLDTAEEWCLDLDDRTYEMTVAVAYDEGLIDIVNALDAGCSRFPDVVRSRLHP